MQIIKSTEEIKKLRTRLKNDVGFVPTMGNLHLGHASLIKKSKSENSQTIVSIFINPTQFDDIDDFASYPKTIDKDVDLLKELDVDYLFLPNSTDIYRNGFDMHIIDNSPISKIMEGVYRPGHFDGMLSIVLKLFMLIKPTRAYFGEKDYQQLTLVKSLIDTFFLDIEIIACSTIRDHNKLALSSRNSKLNNEQLNLAPRFAQVLEKNITIDEMKAELIKLGFKIDYIENYQNRIYAAVYIGDIRLIDNILLGENR